jgi:xanthine dehydrogenase molybdopterin-binding subunit B
LAEVEVDTETGKVKVMRYWAARDPGRIANPMGAEGQIEGGVVMGLGMALWEKIVRDGGFVLNPGMRDYLLPGAKDAPPEITIRPRAVRCGAGLPYEILEIVEVPLLDGASLERLLQDRAVASRMRVTTVASTSGMQPFRIGRSGDAGAEDRSGRCPPTEF